MGWAWNISPRPVFPPVKWHVINTIKMPESFVRYFQVADHTLHIPAIRNIFLVQEMHGNSSLSRYSLLSVNGEMYPIIF
jgi:hypothetical protein